MKTIFGFVTLMITTLLAGCTTALDTDVSILETPDSSIQNSNTLFETSDDSYGSSGALENTTFTIEDMLVYALQDEYTARAEYEYIQETFDIDKPFSNIMSSEETHISLLLPLFDTYGIVVIDDTANDHLITITSLEEAYATGVQAEISNIAMYNLFLQQDDLPQDLIDVFTKLRDASEHHLDAFQKNLDRY